MRSYPFLHRPSIETTAHRKLGRISEEVNRIARQSLAEKISNIKHDEGAIAGCLEDLSDALTDYQVGGPVGRCYLLLNTLIPGVYTAAHSGVGNPDDRACSPLLSFIQDTNTPCLSRKMVTKLSPRESSR